MTPSRIATCLLFVVAIVVAPRSLADLDDGLSALKRGDYAAAAKALKPLAERGDAEAQYRVGLMYEVGKGFPVDKPQAVAWLRKAGDQGHALAQSELGVIFATGDGVKQDDVQSASWFRKAAEQGNAVAQYNLGLLYAKGQGVKHDDAQAIAWFRKSADGGYNGAQFKLGVAYDNGQGVAKDPVLAYASYAIAARNGSVEAGTHRDEVGRALNAVQLREAQAIAAAWQPGQPMPARAGGTAMAQTAQVAPVARRAPDTCSASGSMEGESFMATHCAVAVYDDQHSVSIWFNQDAIAEDEVANFQLSSDASDSKAGKPRTLLRIMFCPGGGSQTASPAAVKAMDLSTSSAKSPLAGVQWVVEAPKDFTVEKLTGDIKPGGNLAGRITGKRARTSWTLDFDVNLPSRDAAAGMSCR